MKKINVALVGLGFGGAFVDIYKHHPNVESIKVYDPNIEHMNYMANALGVETYPSFEAILADPAVDAVHLVSPIPAHEEQTVQVLEAGKHCACTVPMATSLEGIKRITEATRKSGKKYMMMETTLYTYQFHYVKHMLESGELGRIQFMRGSHYQDMENWPDYWFGLPPMWYGTHAIGPMVALSGSRIQRVVCFGSGTMDEAKHAQYGNPYPVESALFEFANGMKGEATRTLFETARLYQEGLFVYGSKKSFEWGFADWDQPYVTEMGDIQPHRGRPTWAEVTEMPNFYENLPEPLQRFTVGGNYDPLNPQESLKKGAGAGHHGSHPHLVNEFVMSIIEDRRPYIDEVLGGNITAAGICAHESAMRGGEFVTVPEF
jgi:predicted dehydrogenase